MDSEKNNMAKLEHSKIVENIKLIDINNLLPNPWNPYEISEENLPKLMESMRQENIIQPLVVREVSKGYEILDGEQRWKAIQELNNQGEKGFAKIPCLNMGSIDDQRAKKVTLKLAIKGEPLDGKLSLLFIDLLEDETAVELAEAIPYTDEEINDIAELVNMDWDKYQDEWEEKAEEDETMQLSEIFGVGKIPLKQGMIIKEAVDTLLPLMGIETKSNKWTVLTLLIDQSKSYGRGKDN